MSRLFRKLRRSNGKKGADDPPTSHSHPPTSEPEAYVTDPPAPTIRVVSPASGSTTLVGSTQGDSIALLTNERVPNRQGRNLNTSDSPAPERASLLSPSPGTRLRTSSTARLDSPIPPSIALPPAPFLQIPEPSDIQQLSPPTPLIYLDDNLISPETPNLANPHLLSPSAHSTPVNRTALLIPPNPSRPVTPDPPNTPRLGEYLAPGPLSRSPSIISDTASIIDSSVSFVQSGNTFNVGQGGSLVFNIGAQFEVSSGLREQVQSKDLSLIRIVFDLSVNRFFRIAQRIVPRYARKAIYKWFESNQPLPQNTYARALMVLAHGYPIWRPVPKLSDPYDIQQRGVQVGDVGILAVDGSFTFLFNVYEPRGKSTAAVCSSLRKGGISRYTVYHPGVVLRNKAYDLTDGTYLSYKARGGILYLPDAVERSDSCIQESFRKFAFIHGREWYELAYQEYEGKINGCLYFVTGHDTTSSSLMAVHYSQHTVGIRLEPKAERPKEAHVTLAWNENQGSGGVQKNYNPQVKNSASGDILVNQAVFIRGFRIKIRSREEMLRRMMRSKQEMEISLKRIGLERISNADVDSFLKEGTELPEPLRLSGGAPRSRTVHSTHGESKFPQEDFYHPSDVINNFLLGKMYPDATIAVTHDYEWMRLLRDGDEEMLGNGELLKRWLRDWDGPQRNVGIEYYPVPTRVTRKPPQPRVFILQDAFFVNYGDTYPHEIRWSLFAEIGGERLAITQGRYIVNSERLRLARFRQAQLRWRVQLTMADGQTVVVQGQRTIESLLSGDR